MLYFWMSTWARRHNSPATGMQAPYFSSRKHRQQTTWRETKDASGLAAPSSTCNASRWRYLLQKVGRITLCLHQKFFRILYVDDHFFDLLPDLIKLPQSSLEFLDGELQFLVLVGHVPSDCRLSKPSSTSCNLYVFTFCENTCAYVPRKRRYVVDVTCMASPDSFVYSTAVACAISCSCQVRKKEQHAPCSIACNVSENM